MFQRLLVHAMSAFYPSHDGLPGVGELGADAYVEQELMVDVRGLMWVGVVAATWAFILLPFCCHFKASPKLIYLLTHHSTMMSQYSSSPNTPDLRIPSLNIKITLIVFVVVIDANNK